MGYDFSFVCLAQQPDTYPFLPTSDVFQALQNPLALEQRLLEHGGFKRNGAARNGYQSYWWNTPDGGSLDVCVYEKAIYVDTHSHWRYVLELYRFLCVMDPKLLILENTKGLVHDENSYRELASYSRET